MDVTSSTRAPSALVSLLDLLDGPAALLDGSARVLGASASMLALAQSLGLPALDLASDLAPGLVAADLPVSAELVQERSFELRDGRERGARLLPVGSLVGERLVLLVLDPVNDGSASAARRRASRLRHDLAGPLTAILGTTELLLMREESLDRDGRAALQEILSQCSRLADLIVRDRRVHAQVEAETP